MATWLRSTVLARNGHSQRGARSDLHPRCAARREPQAGENERKTMTPERLPGLH